MSLRIAIAAGGSVPIHRQIADQVCRALAAGRLREGDQLPSVRALAEELVVNPNTVARAYADLVRDGVLEAQPGKGVFASRRRAVYTKAERLRRIAEPLDALVNQALIVGMRPAEIEEALSERLRRLDPGAGGHRER